MGAVYYKLGTTLPGTLLSALTTKVTRPKSTFEPYADYRTSSSGLVTGLGDPIIEWQWAFLPRAMRDQLRTFCTGPSAYVYVRTQINDTADIWATYYAIMNWPKEDREATRRVDFVLRFTMCKFQYTTEP